MRSVKTAKGRMIDMSALAAKNESAKAVGNVLMNARGDRLNPDGTIRWSAEEIARADAAQRTPPVQTPISDPKPIVQEPQPEPEIETEIDIPTPKPEPEVIGRITRTRDDGTKYVEIEYEDGSIETNELIISEE
jgi:outer membrane biosynthesis protein TonB